MRTFSAAGADADWRAVDVALDAGPARRSPCAAPTGEHVAGARCRCPGDFNVANALCAVAALGRGRARPAAVAGGAAPRRPACPAGWSGSTPARTFLAVVDYAHKPDAVEAALRSAAAAHRRAG